MSFQQGLSGLNTAAKALDITSNNVANATTVGFKAASAHFGDAFANSLAGSGAAQVGIGATVTAIPQSFNQGNLTATNNPLDMAINGSGFFRMSNNGSITYTRNGQFHVDKAGYLVDDGARRLTGYPALTDGTIVQSAAQDLVMSAAPQDPVATGASLGGSYQGAKAVMNLDSSKAPPALPWAPAAAPGIYSPPVTTYNYSTAMSIYDSLGAAHTMTLYMVKTATTGVWDVHVNVDGTADTNVTLTTPTLTFGTDGKLTALPNGIVGVSIDLDQVMTDLGNTNAAGSPLAFNIDFTNTTQFGVPFATTELQQDGYTAGRLTGLNVAADGTIKGSYSNGQSRSLGQVVLANFANPNGLTSLGGNQWVDTSESGSALVGAPGSGNLGALQSGGVEDSNVDLTAELVNMITQQRNYQANAQSIKTQDQVLQTLVNLR